MTTRTFLDTVPGLKNAPAADLDALAAVACQRPFVRRESISLEDQDEAPFLIVESGLVKICRSSLDGRELLLDVLRPREIVGGCCGSVGSGKASCGVVGLAAGRVLAVRGGTWKALLKSRPELRAAFFDHVLSFRRRCVTLASQLALGSIDSRLGSLLLRLAGYSDDASDSREVPPVLTQDEIAAAIGTVREVVTRHVSDLVTRGVLARSGRRIIVRDPRTLASLAALM